MMQGNKNITDEQYDILQNELIEAVKKGNLADAADYMEIGLDPRQEPSNNNISAYELARQQGNVPIMNLFDESINKLITIEKHIIESHPAPEKPRPGAQILEYIKAGIISLLTWVAQEAATAVIFECLAGAITRDIGYASKASGEQSSTITGKYNSIKIGESLNLNFTSGADGYLTLLNKGTSGLMYVLAPNFHVPSTKCMVEKGEKYNMQDSGYLPDDFEFIENGPKGTEIIYALVTEEPLISQKQLDLVGRNFIVLSGQQEEEIIKRAHSQKDDGILSYGEFPLLVE